MSTTVTSAVGYGLKIDKKAFTEATGIPAYYSDSFLDERQASNLRIQEVGFSGNEEHWIFIQSGFSKVYSGISGNGNSATLVLPMLGPEGFSEQQKELFAWMDTNGQSGFPAWSLVQYIN